MKILRIVSLLGCGLLWSCQSQEPAAPPTDDVPDIKTVETVIQQITNDVNSVEVDNIIGSLFGKEKKGRSAEYDVHVIKDDKGNDRIICVNFADNKGYALVSAVKSYEPILAYAETGHFSPDDELPLPVKAWMENTMIDIDESQTLPTDSLAKIASKWRRYEHNEKTLMSRADDFFDHSKFYNLTPEELQRLFHIMKPYLDSWAANDYRVYSIDDYSEPIGLGDKFALAGYVQGLICPIYFDDYWAITIVKVKEVGKEYGIGHWMRTTWNQLNDYNMSFPLKPNDNSKHIPVGCGPLAVGQIMHAYRYPDTYDWDNMATGIWGDKRTSDFLLDVFHKCNAYYVAKEDGTACKQSDRIKALKEYGYTCGEINGKNLTEYNLMTGCPAIVASTIKEKSGKDTEHAWVIEGAKTFESYREVEIWTFTYPDTFTSIYHEESDFSQSRLLYINWGYPSPGYNGYYSFSSMTPKIATGNGPVTDYTSNRLNEAIINIRPNK